MTDRIMEAQNAAQGLSLDRIMTDAVTKAAASLQNCHRFDVVWSEGTTLVACQGRLTFVVRNSIARNQPELQEKVLNLYASMVVHNLLRAKCRL